MPIPEPSSTFYSSATHLQGADQLTSLPTSCLNLICAYAGFGSMVSRLHSTERPGAIHEPLNALFGASRRLTAVARSAAWEAWRAMHDGGPLIKGAGGHNGVSEWKLFRAAMVPTQRAKEQPDAAAGANTGADAEGTMKHLMSRTLCAFDLKTQIAAARHCGIVIPCTGSVRAECPLLAAKMLHHSGLLPDSAAKHNMSNAAASTSEDSVRDLPRWLLACACACLSAQSTARFSRSLADAPALATRQQQQRQQQRIGGSMLRLYRQIEAPLLLLLARVESDQGTLADPHLLRMVLQDLTDRNAVLERYFRVEICGGEDFDPHGSSAAATISSRAAKMQQGSVEPAHSYLAHHGSGVPRNGPTVALNMLTEYRRNNRDSTFAQTALCRLKSGPGQTDSVFRPTFDSYGTTTGRITVFDPPLQLLSKKNTYSLAIRPTLWHLEVSAMRQRQGSGDSPEHALLGRCRARVWESVQGRLRQGSDIWVRVALPARPSDPPGRWWRGPPIDETPERIPRQEYHPRRVVCGRLLSLTQTPVNAPSVAQQHTISTATAPSIGPTARSVKEIWGSEHYPPPLCYQVLQVVVILAACDAATTAGAVLAPEVGGAILSVPADAVIPLDAVLESDDVELAHLRASLRDSPSIGLPPRNAPLVKLSQRGAFSAFSTHRVLLAADYCQVELRLLAHFSRDPALCQAFSTPLSTEEQGLDHRPDVFVQLASIWRGVSRECISPIDRNRIKHICYASIYGAGISSVANDLDMGEDEASALISSFHGQFPGIRRLQHSLLDTARRSNRSDARAAYVSPSPGGGALPGGVCVSGLGRARRIPDLLHAKNSSAKSAAERRVLNTLCQGSASDLLKVAMLRISAAVEHDSECGIDSDAFLAPRLVLAVHDELIFDIDVSDVNRMATLIRNEMVGAGRSLGLTVPLDVKISVGPTWGDLTEHPV